MKTIAGLNQKWWYRLMKVAFVLSFIVVAPLVAMSVYSSNMPFSYTDYQVTCNYGNKETFLAFQDKRILITNYDLRDGLASLSDYAKTDLQNACDISELEIQRSSMSVYGVNLQVQPLYTIAPERVTDGSVWIAIGYSALALSMVAVVFEIFRRLFYYIILGSFRPIKRE
jgi:hypothetical protein